jgi:hypothetical protein
MSDPLPSNLRSLRDRIAAIDCYTAQGARDAGLHFADISTEHVRAFQDHVLDMIDEALQVESTEAYGWGALIQRAKTFVDPVPARPLCDGEVRVIYEHGEPSGVRDDGGYLCHFNRVPKWSGQEDRYRRELALRARQAEVIANALRGAVKAPAEPKDCSQPSPSDDQESAFAFLLSVAADDRYSNEYVGNVVRSWLHVLDGSSTPVKTTERTTDGEPV